MPHGIMWLGLAFLVPMSIGLGLVFWALREPKRVIPRGFN